MKTLFEHLHSLDYIAKRKYKYQLVSEVLDINEDEFDMSRDYVLETLTTHDTEALKEKIRQEFEVLALMDETIDKLKGFKVIFSETPDEHKLKNLLDFYGYYITIHEHNFYNIAPKFTDNYTKFIQDKCHNVLFHLTPTKNVNSILRSGLRCKKADYRNFPERIYIIAIPTSKMSKFDTIIANVVEDMGMEDIDDYTILRIDLKNHNIPFYKDDAMYNENTFFTYNNIPGEYIKVYSELNKIIKTS